MAFLRSSISSLDCLFRDSELRITLSKASNRFSTRWRSNSSVLLTTWLDRVEIKYLNWLVAYFGHSIFYLNFINHFLKKYFFKICNFIPNTNQYWRFSWKIWNFCIKCLRPQIVILDILFETIPRSAWTILLLQILDMSSQHGFHRSSLLQCQL